jgi:Tol biopolymer transport system component
MRLLLPFLLLASLDCLSQSRVELVGSDTATIFGPGIISDGFSNRDMALSPDGNDLYYTLQWSYGLFSVILHSAKKNGEWTKPETASFSGRYNDLEPAYSPDGQKLFFTSNRPLHEYDSSKDYDIWFMLRKRDGWEGPFNAGSEINTARDEFYPSLAKNGNLYFTRDNGETKDDIFMSSIKNGKYEEPVRLPDAVNSKNFDFNAFIDPDENFIIFSSYKRADDLGGGDLYYSLRRNGNWQPAVHFGKNINSSALDYSPFVSGDKKYFFFTSKRQLAEFPFKVSKTAAQIREVLNSFGNGNDDIYIMNFKVVEEVMQTP